jgi:hypothetical protein
MDDDQKAPVPSPEEQAHVGPPDLIVQAIVPPTDAPAEIRAAVADALARRGPAAGPAHTWEDISFAASAIALVEGTNQRAEPDMQWVFAIGADSPRLGERVQNTGAWASTIVRRCHGSGASREQWRISVFDTVTTAPRS